jgi:hypothetical protein
MNEPLEDAPDGNPYVRPGEPEMKKPARPVGHAHWKTPEKQGGVRVLKDATRTELTATFGTGQPPRGLSGILRTYAYRIPDYEIKRWALLLFADRVDKLENDIERSAGSPATWVFLGAGSVALAAFAAHRRLRA